MKTKNTYNENELTFTLSESTNLWLAFAGTDGVSVLNQASLLDPSVANWSVNVTADKINSMLAETSYLYLALDDNTYQGGQVNKLIPNLINYFTKHSGINEQSVDLITDDNFVYFLTPGILSGENAKIIKYNKLTQVYVETINLLDVTNAKKIDIDMSGRLIVMSNLDSSSPTVTKIVSVGGIWSHTNYELS